MGKGTSRFFRLIGKFILLMANLGVGLAMIVSAYAGTLDPEIHPIVAIGGMTYPIWVPLMFLIGIADALWLRTAAVWAGLVFALTLPMTVRTIPVNIPRGTVPTGLKPDSWTLMTYNVSTFMDLRETPSTPNATLEYILFHSPDVVVLQEVSELPTADSLGVTQSQLDALNSAYPNILIGNDISLLSKFPAERLTEAEEVFSDSTSTERKWAGAFLLTVKDQKVLLIGTHLCSIGLTTDDKELYGELTRGQGLTDRDEIKAVKNDLLSKLADANEARGTQAKKVVSLIDSLGINNVIVAGDFNDVPGCFGYRLLEKEGLRAVYPQVGCGYKMTFHADRFYFMIDHIFVRGNFVPWSIKRGDLKSSDHYPQLVTFVESLRAR
ncbi:MAG: endonuclease/exonuclease/phosphatase family protein [Muribaculaceae bacterium]|nr:endonuclease/exonuclease/phosphatase family protein [Muribaculaceae bacterium]